MPMTRATIPMPRGDRPDDPFPRPPPPRLQVAAGVRAEGPTRIRNPASSSSWISRVGVEIRGPLQRSRSTPVFEGAGAAGIRTGRPTESSSAARSAIEKPRAAARRLNPSPLRESGRGPSGTSDRAAPCVAPRPPRRRACEGNLPRAGRVSSVVLAPRRRAGRRGLRRPRRSGRRAVSASASAAVGTASRAAISSS